MFVWTFCSINVSELTLFLFIGFSSQSLHVIREWPGFVHVAQIGANNFFPTLVFEVDGKTVVGVLGVDMDELLWEFRLRLVWGEVNELIFKIRDILETGELRKFSLSPLG